MLALLGTALPARAAWVGNDPAYQPAWDRIKSEGVLKVGCPSEQPYAGQDPATKEWSGFHIEMAKDVARLLGVKWECVPITWDNSALAIQSGRVDLVFTLSATPQRAMAMAFAGPVYMQSYMMVNRPGFAQTTWEDYNKPEVRVAVAGGSSNEVILDLVAPKATKVRLGGGGAPVMAVSSGRADAFLSSMISGVVARGKNPGVGDITVPTPTRAFPGYVGLRQEPDQRLRDFLQAWAEWNRLNGQTEKWIRQALIGFGVPEAVLPQNMRFGDAR